jgi:hypothetical protein
MDVDLALMKEISEMVILRRLSLVGLLAAVALVVLNADRANAGLLNLRMAQPNPAEMLPVPDPSLGPVALSTQFDPGIAAAPAVCCPTPCISYRHVGRPLKCCTSCCEPPVQTVLTIKDSCSCCPINIPVCLPGCCKDCPTESCRPGLGGRGVYTYDWCCGVRIVVRVQRDGGILVTYHNA